MKDFSKWVGSTGGGRAVWILVAAARGSGPSRATFRRAGVALLASLTVIAVSPSPASAQTSITVESGVGQVGFPDNSVTVTDSCVGTPTYATIVSPISSWAGPIGDTQWDARNSSTIGCNGTYQATFSLPADVISPSLSITELADNSTNVSVNGNQPFITGNVPGQCQFDYGGPPVSGTTTFGLVPGVNTLTFNVDNCYPAWGSQQPTGIDFVATVTFSEAGPLGPDPSGNWGLVLYPTPAGSAVAEIDAALKISGWNPTSSTFAGTGALLGQFTGGGSSLGTTQSA